MKERKPLNLKFFLYVLTKKKQKYYWYDIKNNSIFAAHFGFLMQYIFTARMKRESGDPVFTGIPELYPQL